jgi:hypothetical protein
MTKSQAAQKRLEENAIKADLNKQLEIGREEREKKLFQSMTQLGRQLQTASEKYLTVNGFMQARTTYEQVLFGTPADLGTDDVCRDIARRMSELAGQLAQNLKGIKADDISESFLDGLLDKQFVLGTNHSPADVTLQLLKVNLLQNVGPAIDEIVQFREGVDAGIATILAELEKHGSIPGQITLAEAEGELVELNAN